VKDRLAAEAPYVIGLLLGAIVLMDSGYLDRSPEVVRRNDFALVWAGARAIALGHDPYRVADWPALAASLGGWADTPAYVYPGWVAVGLLPLGALPLEAASALWTFGGLALAALAVRALVRAYTPDLPVVHTLAALTLLASQPARTAVFLGQWSFALVAALSLSMVLIRGRPAAAGVASVAFLGKPQLFLLTAPALLSHAWRLGRARAFVAGAGAAAALLTLVSLMVLPAWPLIWGSVSTSQRLFDPPQTTTVPALLSGLLGPPFGAVVLALAAVGAGIALLFRPGSAAGLGIWTVLSLLVAPYQWSYDQLILVPAIVLVSSAIREVSRRRALLTAAAACALLLVLGTLLAVHAARTGRETLAALVPLLTLGVLVIGAWPLRERIGRRVRA
jgi:hypothetical protein